jgi:hypothetical protein
LTTSTGLYRHRAENLESLSVTRKRRSLETAVKELGGSARAQVAARPLQTDGYGAVGDSLTNVERRGLSDPRTRIDTFRSDSETTSARGILVEMM